MKDDIHEEKLSIVNCQLSISEFLRKDEQKDLLRFLTAGSVDDGKSTLIGRLLFDSTRTSWMHWNAIANEWEMPAIILTMRCCWMA